MVVFFSQCGPATNRWPFQGVDPPSLKTGLTPADHDGKWMDGWILLSWLAVVPVNIAASLLIKCKNVINKILAATLAHVNLPYFPVYLCNVLCWNFITAFLKHVSHLFEWEPSNPAPARVRRWCGIHPPVSQGKGVRKRWGDKYKNSKQTSSRTLEQKSFKSGWK